MDQKPPQSPENQNQQPQAGTPATPPAQPVAPVPSEPAAPATPTPVSPAPTPGDGAHGAGTPPPPGSPEHQYDAHPGKSKTMLYAVLTLVVVVIGAVIVTFMVGSKSKPAEQPQTVEKQQVVPPTEAPTVAPSPASYEEQIDAVNTTENDSDLQDADKDLQSL